MDARHIFRQIDSAHREFTPEQIEFLGNIVRLYRGEKLESQQESAKMLAEKFPKGMYADFPGLCKVATVKEIEAQGWSLNPGRYVGVAEEEADNFDFKERLEELNEELETLNARGTGVVERGLPRMWSSSWRGRDELAERHSWRCHSPSERARFARANEALRYHSSSWFRWNQWLP